VIEERRVGIDHYLRELCVQPPFATILALDDLDESAMISRQKGLVIQTLSKFLMVRKNMAALEEGVLAKSRLQRRAAAEEEEREEAAARRRAEAEAVEARRAEAGDAADDPLSGLLG
jgi:hypothetical protein